MVKALEDCAIAVTNYTAGTVTQKILLIDNEERIMSYEIKIRTQELSLIPITNIGAYADHLIGNGEFRIMSTDFKPAFDAWCDALKKAGRPFDIISD